jgi:NAD(P)H-quinone oxidoreductase subunit 2
MAGFFGKIYLFWAGWQAGAYGLVLLGLVTSVISIYYYIRVIKMMVVKEPQEMSETVKNYPVITWTPFGMRPLQVGLILTLIATSLSGILANPILNFVNAAVEDVPRFEAKVPGKNITASTPVTRPPQHPQVSQHSSEAFL